MILKHIHGGNCTLSGVTTSQWNGRVCFFFELLLFRFMGNGGGAGGRGTMTAAGLDSWLRDCWIEVGDVEAAWAGGGWGVVGRTGVGTVSEPSGPTSGADVFLLGLGAGL